MFDQIFSILAPIITVIVIGYVFGKTVEINVRQLTDISLYVFTSALVFRMLVNTKIPTEQIFLMGISIVILYAILAASGILIGKYNNEPTNFISASLLCILFVNSGNMGLPFNLFAYGEPGLEIASIYLVFNALLTFSVGIFIAARGNKSTKQSLTTIFKLPLIYAVLLAIVVRFFQIDKPHFVFVSIDLLQQAAVPVLLIILGIQIARTEITKNIGQLNYVIILRLMISPIIAFFIAELIGMKGLIQKVFIIQSAMPVAINSVILAIKFNIRPNFVANVAVISTIISILSLAVVFTLVEMLL